MLRHGLIMQIIFSITIADMCREECVGRAYSNSILIQLLIQQSYTVGIYRRQFDNTHCCYSSRASVNIKYLQLLTLSLFTGHLTVLS